MRACYCDGWYIMDRVENQFMDGAILATGLHLESVGVGGIQVTSQIFLGTPLFGRFIYQDK